MNGKAWQQADKEEDQEAEKYEPQIWIRENKLEGGWGYIPSKPTPGVCFLQLGQTP